MGASIDELPIELLASIISHIEVSGLYPSCFVVCKRFHAATLFEPIWEQRCFTDLQVTHEDRPGNTSWREMYKDNCSCWDPKSVPLSAQQRDLGIDRRVDESGPVVSAGECHENVTVSGPKGNGALILHGKRLTWSGTKGWVSIKGRRRFTSGIHSFDFKIIQMDADYASVGVVQQDWDPTLYCYSAEGKKYPSSLWRDGRYWDAPGCGRTEEWSPNFDGSWEVGSVIGVQVDFIEKKLHFFIDDKLHLTKPMEEDMTTLWPSATWSNTGVCIELVYRKENYTII